jgi:hypothetical protein
LSPGRQAGGPPPVDPNDRHHLAGTPWMRSAGGSLRSSAANAEANIR